MVLRKRKNKLSNFSTPYEATYLDNVGFLSEFSSDGKDGIVTQALVLVEGIHTDNKQRKHTFTKDRLQKIAQNSNAAFNSGVPIPLLKDHNKTASGYCGDITDEFIVRPVTEQDIPEGKESRLSHLVGKLAVFANGIAVKTQEAISNYMSGLKSISPGIDINTDTIREISLTPMPAIPGMTLFNSGLNSRPLTWDDQDQGNIKLEELREQFDTLSDQFFNLIENIYTATENELEDRDPTELVGEALQEYINRLVSTLGLEDEGEGELDPSDPNNPSMQGQMMGNQNIPMAGQGMGQYSLGYVADELADFGYWEKAGNAVDALGNMGKTVFRENIYPKLPKQMFGKQLTPGSYKKALKWGAKGTAGLGGLYLANRYLNPLSGRNQRIKREEEALSSPLGRLKSLF